MRIAKLMQRIGHGLYWRWCDAVTILRQWRAQVSVAWRWRVTKSRGRPHRLPGELIVSLTSYPPRFATLSLTVRSLLRQTVKADRTILWIAQADLAALPASVKNLQAAGLEIRAAEDLKSYKKIIPALDAFPDAFLCTADDDLYYWPTWLEELAEGANRTDRIVACHRAHEITLDSEGKPNSYSQWTFDTSFRGKSSRLFPTGVGGVFYPPGALAHGREDRAAAFALCPRADDVWLYWMGRRNGAIYRTAGRRRHLVMWRGSQQQVLWHENVLQGGNDEQIRKMAKKYGYPPFPFAH